MSLLKFERTLFKEPPVFTKWERTTMLYICTCIDRSVGCKWVKEYISCYPASIFKKLIWFYSRKVHELPDSTAVVSWGGVAIKAFPLLKWRFCNQQFSSDFISSLVLLMRLSPSSGILLWFPYIACDKTEEVLVDLQLLLILINQ